MPLAVVLALKPTMNLVLQGALGREGQAWFLGQVARHDPTLAEALHAEPSVRPYAASTLLDAAGFPLAAGGRLTPTGTCWLRVTAYADGLCETLLDSVLPGLPARLTLRGADYTIIGYALQASEHAWAGQATFGALVQAGGQQARSHVGLEFVSPTAFRSEGADIALPVPALVFRSYWRKWNAFAPRELQIDGAWPSFAEACIRISELRDLNSARWEIAGGERGASLGFTGRVRFMLVPAKGLEMPASLLAGAAQVLQALAAFAFYCGTGHHTTIGLGQTRPLPQQ